MRAVVAQILPSNIIFILIDDMGWQELGSCNFKRPTSKLAAEGLQFTQGYHSTMLADPRRLYDRTVSGELESPITWRSTTSISFRPLPSTSG